jgi:hypothetical protein
MIHRITASVTASESGSNSGTNVSGTTSKSGSTAISIDTVLGAVTDSAIPCAFTVANLQSCILLASRDCTIEVNSGSAPTSTISLKAGSPLAWFGDYFTSPFSGTTTCSTLYVTTSASTRLQVLIIAN